MNLFELVNHRVTFSPEALTLKPFYALWERDKSKDKEVAVAELAAVYFYADYKSDFADLLDEEERIRQIRAYTMNLPQGWKPDPAFNAAVDFYKKRQETITTRLYESALIGIDKIDRHLRTVDFAAVDKSGKPKYNPKQTNDMIKSLGDTMESLKKLNDLIKKEKEDDSSLRGGRSKGFFED